MISDFVADQYVTLTANPEYKGDNAANIEEITVRFIPDPLAAAQALENGEVDVISPQATADLKTAVDAIDGATVITGVRGHVRAHRPAVRERQEPGEHLQGPEGPRGVPQDDSAPGDRRQAHRADRRRRRAAAQLADLRSRFGGLRRVRREQHARTNFAEVDIPGATALLAESGRHQPRGLHPVRVEQPPSCERVRPDPGFGQLRPASTSRTAVRKSGAACSARPARTTRSSSAGSPRASA